MRHRSIKSKETYLKEKKILLEGFGIKVSQEISEKISEMYPEDREVEKYTRKLILAHLGDD